MLALLAALAALAADPASARRPASIGRTAWIVATVGHSEFCPAGNLRLDLATGRYAFTPRAALRVCGHADLERPIEEGRLGRKRLTAARAAFARVLAEGLEKPACREGFGPDSDIIVNNGGTPLLVVTNGAGTGVAPEDLTCWSDAASALHDALDALFESAHQH